MQNNPGSIYMYNSRIGFISRGLSFSSPIRKTIDGGNTWNIVDSGGFIQMHFIDSLVGWRTRLSHILYKTTDGGYNWIEFPILTGGHLITPTIENFSIINKDTIWGGGNGRYNIGTGSRSMIWKTTNSGNTWGYQLIEGRTSEVSYLEFINKNIGWAYYFLEYGGVHTITGGDTLTYFTSIEQISTEIPKNFILYQNYPNPFNPITNIKYSILKQSSVSLKVYDVSGKEIQTLVSKRQGAGTYLVTFEGNNYSSGVYFYSLSVNGAVVNTKKMLLIK